MSRKYAISLRRSGPKRDDTEVYRIVPDGSSILQPGLSIRNAYLNFRRMYGTLTPYMWCLVAAPVTMSNVSFPEAYVA